MIGGSQIERRNVAGEFERRENSVERERESSSRREKLLRQNANK